MKKIYFGNKWFTKEEKSEYTYRLEISNTNDVILQISNYHNYVLDNKLMLEIGEYDEDEYNIYMSDIEKFKVKCKIKVNSDIIEYDDDKIDIDYDSIIEYILSNEYEENAEYKWFEDKVYLHYKFEENNENNNFIEISDLNRPNIKISIFNYYDRTINWDDLTDEEWEDLIGTINKKVIIDNLIINNETGYNIFIYKHEDETGFEEYDEFNNYYLKDSKKINNVIFTDKVKYINDNSFKECELDNILFSENLEVIGENAFSKCINLNKLIIPKNVNKIGEYAFYNCLNIENIDIKSDKLYKLDTCTFRNCAKLKNVKLHENLNTLGLEVFADCTSLETINIDNITHFETMAFENCTKLNIELNFSDGLEILGSNVFYNCINLNGQELIIPNGITEIYAHCFSKTPYKHILLPDSIEKIYMYCFSDCVNLTDIKLPNNLKQIDIGLFNGCTNLTSVTLPETVEKINMLVFSDCVNLTKVNIPENVLALETGLFKNCSSLKNIIIPESVNRIESGCFENCSSLTKLKVPKKLNNNDTKRWLPEHMTINDVEWY